MKHIQVSDLGEVWKGWGFRGLAMRRLGMILLVVMLFLLLTPGLVWADEWQELEPAPAPPGRFGHTMTKLNDQIYVYGGVGNNAVLLNDLWRWDSVNNKWVEVKPTGSPPARHSHSAVVSSYTGQEKMYVFFGADLNGNVHSDVWSYSASTNKWKQEPSVGTTPTPRYLHSSTTLPDGRIVIFGGYAKKWNNGWVVLGL